MENAEQTPEQIIAQTQNWLKKVVIGHLFCPFVNKVFEAQTIHYQVVPDYQLETCLQALMTECQKLDHSTTIETTLIIYPNGYSDFDAFLDCLAVAETLLVAQGYEGIYQLASFHPRYQFAGSAMDDPANYTNRSPYPMLHLLRETSLERAIINYPDSENIPQRNIEYARKLGEQQMIDMLASCL